MKVDTGGFGLGGAPLGNLYAPMSDAEAGAVMRAALARGVGYFDTAPHYGNGLSEHRMGTALRDVPRERFVLSTKVGRLLVADPGAPRDQHGYVGVLPFVQRWDYSRDATLRSIEDSLQRLGLARIDYVYVHDVARDTHGDAWPQRWREVIAGAAPALSRLRAEGVIAGYGLGVNEVEPCLAALADADPDVFLLAGRYTLLDQSALTELLPQCVARGAKVVAGGPFNSGILATGSRPANGSAPFFNYAPATPEIIARTAAIEAVCAAHAVPLKAAALQFPLAHPAVTCVLAGARGVQEIEENVALAAHPIRAAFWRDLKTQALLHPAAPLPSDS